MHTNFSIVGVLYLLALIGVIVIVVRQKQIPKPNRFTKYKNRWGFRTYLSILLFATVIYYLLPIESKTLPLISEEEVRHINNQYPLFYEEPLTKEKFAEIDGLLKKKEWEFQISGDELEINTNNEFVQIVAEKKEANDGLVEVEHYTMPSTMDGLDLTDMIPLPELKWKDNILNIDIPFIDLKIASLQTELTITQFTGDKKVTNASYSSINQENIIYLKIPNNVGVNYLDVHYIQK